MQPREVLYRGSGTGSGSGTGTGTGTDIRYEVFVTEEPDKACFVHISKARCSLYGREVVQRFVNRYNLNTYKKTYPYCTHPLLYPLMYGFVPISAFPGCPKFEQLL